MQMKFPHQKYSNKAVDNRTRNNLCDYFLERSDRNMEWNDLEQSDRIPSLSTMEYMYNHAWKSVSNVVLHVEKGENMPVLLLWLKDVIG